MSSPVTASAGWLWPADVLEFADQQNVRQYLGPLLEATRRVFPTARRIQVVLKDDPEIRDDRHIVFDVQVPGLSVSQGLAAQKEWTNELFRCCPAPLVCIFRLCLDIVSA